jgi:hypothetical protein
MEENESMKQPLEEEAEDKKRSRREFDRSRT